MRLFTRPRPLEAWQLRTHDLLAVDSAGALVSSEVAYVDLDLHDEVSWVGVHYVNAAPAYLGPGFVVIEHSAGSVETDGEVTCMMREAIDLDPWSYVKAPPVPRASGPAAARKSPNVRNVK